MTRPRVADSAWMALAVMVVQLFEHRERIAYCIHCEAWYRVGTHSHMVIR